MYMLFEEIFDLVIKCCISILLGNKSWIENCKVKLKNKIKIYLRWRGKTNKWAAITKVDAGKIYLRVTWQVSYFYTSPQNQRPGLRDRVPPTTKWERQKQKDLKHWIEFDALSLWSKVKAFSSILHTHCKREKPVVLSNHYQN